MADTRGFTLIELMIVVAIVAILAALAYPSYQSHILKSRRSDGFAALLQCATQQERRFTAKNSYANPDAAAAEGICGDSPEGYYALAVSNPGCSRLVGGVTVYTCFTATATATSQGAQDRDVACYRLILDELGDKRSQDEAGNTASGCWE
jgi:type IV pilus assembly protein PilE